MSCVYKAEVIKCINHLMFKINVEIREHNNIPRFDIDLNRCNSYVEVSFIGEFYVHSISNSAGQNYDDLLNNFGSDSSVKEIVELWKRWHMNGLNAGTRRQKEFLNQYFSEHNVDYSYDKACSVLRLNDLYEDHGYKYGHSWLVEIVPSDVIDRIKQLMSNDS